MGTFAAVVASLLDTYSKCLSLLESFRGSRPGDNADDALSTNLQSSLLDKSLRSDQASIRRAYSSRLSKDGVRFEKGDAASRSALKRIVKELAAALADVVWKPERRQSLVIDYNSLLALSHGSSLDAVRTIEDLSSRVSSRASTNSSRRSVVSRGRPRSRRHYQQSSVKQKRRSRDRQNAKSKSERRRSNKSPSQSSSRHRHHRSSHSRHTAAPLGNQKRVSILTMSSDSTKLGEIRRRASRQGIYPVKITYPLYTYPLEGVKQRKKWWKIF